MTQHYFQGGDIDDVTLISNEAYTVSNVCPITQMLSSKEKRAKRRAEVTSSLEKSYSRGMDVLPFLPKTDHQEDLWTSLNKNTVTIAIGPSGVGKTLVALW